MRNWLALYLALIVLMSFSSCNMARYYANIRINRGTQDLASTTEVKIYNATSEVKSDNSIDTCKRTADSISNKEQPRSFLGDSRTQYQNQNSTINNTWNTKLQKEKRDVPERELIKDSNNGLCITILGVVLLIATGICILYELFGVAAFLGLIGLIAVPFGFIITTRAKNKSKKHIGNYSSNGVGIIKRNYRISLIIVLAFAAAYLTFIIWILNTL